MTKALILGVIDGEEFSSLRSQPVVLLAGVSDEALDAVALAGNSDLGSSSVTSGSEGGGTGSVILQVVTVEDVVQIGDTLDLVALSFRKHV